MRRSSFRCAGRNDPGPSSVPNTVPSGIRFVLGQTSESNKRRLLLAVAALSATSVLDIIGTLLLGAVGVTLLNALDPSSNPVDLPFVSLFGSLPPGLVIAIVTSTAVAALVAKSLLSWFATRRILRFMARREVEYGGALYARFMKAPFTSTQSMTAQEAIAGVQTGSRSMAALVTQCVMCLAEAVLVLGLSSVLLVASPLLFLFAAVYFGLVTLLVTKFIGQRSLDSNRKSVKAGVRTAQSMNETIGLARELRLYQLTEQFGLTRSEQHLTSALASADLTSWQQAPRYFLETALVVGMALAAVLVLVLQDPQSAALALGLFIVATSRLLPSIQRVNGSWSAAKAAVGSMSVLSPILRLPDPAGAAQAPARDGDLVPTKRPVGASGFIEFHDVSFAYPQASREALVDVNLRIPIPCRVAVVGPSGSGKSTLADLLLGLLEPTSGQVEVLGHHPVHLRGRVAFVAQDVYVTPGTVWQNVALRQTIQADDADRVWLALERAELAEAVRALPDKLDTRLGDRGVRMSGGQRQRIGLARALFREPQLLILDEATSSLDADTEAAISKSIASVSREVAVVTIAHRLATIRDADWVLFLREGRLIDVGAFDELVDRHPDFARTAHLQGLRRSRSAGAVPIRKQPHSESEES